MTIPETTMGKDGLYLLERLDHYPEANGRPCLVKARYRNPRTKHKEIRQLHYNNQNQLVYGLPKGRRLPLFNSPELLEFPAWGVAFGEGESVAISPVLKGLKPYGILSSCFCGSVKKADLSLVEYRRDLFYFWDADEAGARYAIEVKKVLPWVKILPLLDCQEYGDKSDLADFPNIDPADLWFWMEQVDGLKEEDLRSYLERGTAA